MTAGTIPLPALPPPGSEAPSVLAFGMMKGGSTLLFDLLAALAPAAGLAWFSLNDHLFRIGVREAEAPQEAARLFLPRGYCYGGFRDWPPHPIPILGTARAVWLLRDPRDMLVSLYHSTVRSHRIPDAGADGREHYMAELRRRAQAMTLAEFCRSRVGVYQRMFERFLASGLTERPNLRVYRYEDVIFRKREWVDDLCDWYGWRIPARVRRAAAERFDLLPDTPDPDAHVRRVWPGSHRLELAAEDVAFLDGALAGPLRRFGYLPPEG
ncbi:hypothetical protein GCM10010964_10020 [Caldovatus sediminis]|uniref:Sulfotransferase domain-containing protein n=1 Tax=Caldovatus sediminis TaxID=2041189 RepID=A0A8J2Z9B4_9PROT|nr:sulfotransferase domain-containing protein [Caldovatus sediminis]GGG23846.1 hypothetical protein GCM10010964_10020 [Caldovatus sediminis]